MNLFTALSRGSGWVVLSFVDPFDALRRNEQGRLQWSINSFCHPQVFPKKRFLLEPRMQRIGVKPNLEIPHRGEKVEGGNEGTEAINLSNDLFVRSLMSYKW